MGGGGLLTIWFQKIRLWFQLALNKYFERFTEMLGVYDTGEVMVKNMLDRDTEEGVSAFIEKRDPTWEQ